MIFLLLPLVQSTFIYRAITTQQNGPCSASTGILSIPKNLLGGSFTSFTIDGWFKRSSSTSTSNNLLWLVGPDINNYVSFHTAVTINANLQIISCNAVNDCLNFTSTNLQGTQTSDLWVHVTVGMDFLNKQLHYNVQIHTDAMPYPGAYSETYQFSKTLTYTNTQNIVIKNQASNLFGLNGYCGQFNYLTYYGGYYSNQTRASQDVFAQMLIYIPFTETSGTSISNLLSTTQDTGSLVNGVTYSSGGTNYGFSFSKTQYVIFNNQRSQFGPRFTISVWAQVTALNNFMNFFYRETATKSPLLQIQLTSDSSKFDVTVSALGIVADSHGLVRQNLNTWVPLIFSFYNNLNFFTNNNPPGMMLFDILTNGFQNVGVRSYGLYQDSPSDVYYIGDYPAKSTFTSGYFKYASVKIFTGANYGIISSTDPSGCLYSISDLFPACVACQKYLNAGAANNQQMCEESAQPGLITQANIVKCPSQQYYNSNLCSELSDGCLRGTSGTCSICQNFYTLGSGTCTQGSTNICEPGATECKSNIFVQYSQIDQVQTASLACQTGYYLSASLCYQCEATCLTCISGTSCTTCPANKYLNTFCVSSCPLWTDMDNLKCVISCAANQYQIATPKQCVKQCTGGLFAYGSQCLDTCPNQTFTSGQTCVNCQNKCYKCSGATNLECQVCQYGYYLAGNVCENFCANSALYANQLNNQCTSTCSDGTNSGVIYQKQCLFVCPTNFYADTNNNCVSVCPMGYYPNSKQTGFTQLPLNTAVTLTQRLCTLCPVGCTACYMDTASNVLCTGCDAAKFLVGTQCLDDCLAPFTFKDSINQKCLSSCPAPYYTSDKDCVYKCPSGFYNQNGVCSATCNQGFYAETSNNECEACDSRCTQCFGGGENFCDKCQIGYYLYNTICLEVCPSDKQMKNTNDYTCYTSCPVGTLTLADLKECYVTCPSQYITDGTNCTSQCSAGTFSVGATCQTCDNRCALCTDATNTKCQKCAPGIYLDGTTCSNSCVVNPTYYKSIYGYLCVKTCPSTMYIVEDLLECVISCPATYSRLNQNCLQSCPLGMFSNNFLCNKCPPECISCTSYSVCTKCQTAFYQQGNQCLHYCQNNYFQDPTTFQCIATCTLLVDSDGLGNKSCVKSCPVVKYLYQNTCLYQCPDGYYQQTSLKTCNKCALECETCTGNTNQDCIICSSGYQLIDGYCTGKCPLGSFLNVVSCDTCAFRCLTCENTQYGCLTCRGDRQYLPDQNIVCLCKDGYFDDRLNDYCQPCNAPCVNCSASKTCTSCLYNLSPPDCICKRTPPITSDYCITCQLSFASNINFNYDFSQIIVVFTYDIMTSSDEAYFFSTNNCASWFSNDNFGDNAVCMQSSRNFLIQLGTNPTIQPNDKINMKPNVFTDKSSQLCQNTFITQFENMALTAPGMVQPSVVLKYPQVAISTCMDLNIEIIQEIGNAGRSLEYTSWTVSPSTSDIDKILKKATKFFTIPGMTLQANTQYTFTVAYKNFLGNSASQSFQIQTKDASSTTLTLDVLSTDNFYANIDNKVPFSIHDYTCDTTIQETNSIFEVTFKVVSLSSGTQIKNYTLSVQPTNRLTSYFTIDKGTLLPSTSYTFNISIGGSIYDAKTINVGSNQLVAAFLTSDRIVFNSNFTINVTAQDTDVAENISTIGIQYIWSCKNLHLNIQCQTTNKNLLTLPQTQNITVGNLSSGYVYEFTCQVSKGSRVSNIVQQIIITDLNITDQIYNTDVTGKIQIILHDNIVYSLAVQQYYLVILQQYQILHIEFIQRPILRLNLYTYMSGLQNATDVNVIIGGSMVRYNFYVTPALSISKISILPTVGFSLETSFNISVTYNVTNTTQFQYYVYADNQSLHYDLSNFSNKNGFLIQDWTNETNLTTKLPSSKFILVRVNDGSLYGMSYIQTSVTPSSQQVSVKNSVSYISNHNITTVYDAYLSLLELHFVNRQICIYNCWNRGDCINSVCVCDASYYFFSDCSGVQGDYNLWSQTGSKIFSLLQNSTTTEITKNAFTILFQQSQFQGIADLASSNIQSIVDQLSSSLQVSQQRTGIVSQGSQTINYQTPFRMISFLASLNTLAYTNSSTVDQIKSINSQIVPHLNTLLDLTQNSLLISESVNYTTSFMNISVSKKLKTTKSRLLQENTTTQINIYMGSNIFRLSNNFPYPNHTQPLIFSSSDQNNSFSRIVNVLPEKRVTNTDTKKHNFLCILSKDNGTTFGYKDCTQTTTVEPILCQCSAGYATVVDDVQYQYKPFYFTTDYVLDWYFVACFTLGYGILLLIFGIIGWRKDASDWELVRPVSEGFAIKKEKMKVVSQLRKAPKQSQVAPSQVSSDTPKISSLSEDKLQDIEELEGSMKDVFTSSSDIRKCHHENCILGIIFKFRKSLSRGQRLFIIFGRSYILIGAIGFVVNMQVIQIPEMIIYLSSIGFVLRVINPICRQLNKKAKTSKQCQYKCLSIGTVFIQIAVGGILSGIAYLTVYSRLIVYWMVAAAGLLVVDLFVVDLILQLFKLLFDYLVFRNRTAKKEEQQRMIQEKTQIEKLYGQKGYNSIQEIIL